MTSDMAGDDELQNIKIQDPSPPKDNDDHSESEGLIQASRTCSRTAGATLSYPYAAPWKVIILFLVLFGSMAFVFVRACVDKQYADSWPEWYRFRGIPLPRTVVIYLGAVIWVPAFVFAVMALYVKVVVRPSLQLYSTYALVPSEVTGRVQTVHFSSVSSTSLRAAAIEIILGGGQGRQKRVEIYSYTLPKGNRDLDEVWSFMKARTCPDL
ncbi:unnamed protein product [Vitrella brassicaformis CCMP3155]|uniref:Uncharacterized protein n=1 Tax=Vitrella brassicaformis (strain CCMP3155) TaxID=1169540 RepID=A0A0G4EMS5_VITBC|nr:unnamed protein product [Vitrella brassicaformis CCMP3155]|mmetsp:Transcript_16333/g.39193  ORF Transcript_16333/g.39193 Transcript_16333/m.39193 type:complete len:211 (-) Transcript_16333:365-997(-)|eukprot:CEL98285.1 unnamed protein product [Vitrella brassicaformis CCMP3155]